MSGKIKILIGLLILALLSLFLRERQPGGSTFSYRPDGARAFFLFLEAYGQPTVLWRQPFGQLDMDERRAVLFVVSPQEQGGEKELLQWARQGNRVLYFDKFGQGWTRLRAELAAEWPQEVESQEAESQEAGAKKAEAEEAKQQEARRLALTEVLADAWQDRRKESLTLNCDPTFLEECRGVGSINKLLFSVQAPPPSRILAGDRETAHVFQLPVGAGDLWYFAENTLILNQFIDQYDNARFLSQLSADRRPIYFDEFHHGFTEPPPGVARYQQDTLKLSIGVIGLLLLIAALSRGVRFGPPRPELKASHPGSADFASALGLLYAEHGAAAVLANYLEAWRERQAQRLGLSPSASLDRIWDGLSWAGRLSAQDLAARQQAAATLQRGGSYQELNAAIQILEDLNLAQMGFEQRGPAKAQNSSAPDL